MLGALLTSYTIWSTLGGFLAGLVLFLTQNMQNQWAYLYVDTSKPILNEMKHLANAGNSSIPIICQLFVPIGIIATYSFLPESPRWLVYRGRFDEAEAVITDLFGTDHDAKNEVQLLRLQIEEQREINKATSIMDCFRGTNLRRTIIAAGVQILQQAQGVSFINNYIVTFMEQLGFQNVLRSNLIVIVCGVAGNFISVFTFDKVGRRVSLLVGAVLMAAMMMGVGGATSNGTSNLSGSVKNGCVAMLILWDFFFQLSWAPGVWILGGEIGTGQLRERTLLLSSLGSFLTSVPINFVNPYVQDAIGGKVTFIYGSFSVVAIVFVYFFLPETKGRSLEELDEMFQQRVPTKQFETYVCTGLGSAIRNLENRDDDEGLKSKEVEHLEDASVV